MKTTKTFHPAYDFIARCYICGKYNEFYAEEKLICGKCTPLFRDAQLLAAELRKLGWPLYKDSHHETPTR